MDIRAITRADLSVLSEYWYDRRALLQQSDTTSRLLPDARAAWEVRQGQFLEEADAFGYVVEVDGQIVAGLLMRVELNEPGLMPERIGVLRAWVIDLHTTHRRLPMMSTLLQAAQERLAAQGVEQYRVSVPVSLSVEQAFWRGQGARKSDDTFWMTI